MAEKCPVCGLGPVSHPQHVVLMHALAPLMRGIEPDEKDYMRYRYRCANGHKWESSQLDKAEAGARAAGPGEDQRAEEK